MSLTRPQDLKSIVIGASAGLGRALAEELASKGHDLFLVASDAKDLHALRADLAIRFGRNVFFWDADIGKVSAAEIRAQCVAQLGAPDCLFLVSGVSDPENDFENLSEADVDRLVQVNFSSPVKIALAFLPDLLKSRAGTIVGIGSVAQARARGRNTVYASSKQGLEFFFEGLRHKISSSACRVQFYRVGYMATQMTFGQVSAIPIAEPSDLAVKIVRSLEQDRIGRYLPSWWRLIMKVYRAMPWFVFRRMKA